MKQHSEKIISFYKQYRRLPTYSEVMRICALRSKNAVYKIMQKLVAAGVLTKDARGKLSPAALFGEVKLLGVIEAGFPSLAEEETLESMSLDEFLVGNKEATYMLTVKGDSMIEAGIQEGDKVIVERQNHAKPGDIVIAEVDGGWTMKYLRVKNSRSYLEPANRRLHPIYPEEGLRIVGIVRAVVRKYAR